MAQQAPADFSHDVAQAVERRLRALGDDKVRGLASILTPDQAAEAMLRPLPVAQVSSPVNRVVGPFYTTASLTALRKVTREAIRQASARGDILRLWTSDAKAVFPAFQFGPRGELLPGLRAVLDVLAEGHEDPWLWAQWLTGRRFTESSDRPPTNAELLRAGQTPAVLEQARRTAAAWAA
ncbi:hypothetical protein N1028_13775 [Herbiconiux sp. CPCC 203407]|uniref:Uncharacterized protein n=1 Tax=Herbiconiux oxytropis TaxID=2970915 RepID=A0AA42BTZ0_9MICO|nr:hypothetical protein [Herbiconiux oxytropis]MCS5723648.1 hypothetical protein [Herbiconiux oxytropis]MCS5726965.1 hypothetical protein [Herbiconiux oxytropis]